MGLSDRLTFVDEVDDPHEWFSALDVFCLPSREDSFPLVALENATIGNPVVCFQGSGGVNDYIDAGAAVPFLDVDAMADAIVAFAHPALRRAAGATALERAQEYDVDQVGRTILSVITSIAR